MPDLNSRLLLPALLAVALGGCSSSITDVSLGDLNPLKKGGPAQQRGLQLLLPARGGERGSRIAGRSRRPRRTLRIQSRLCSRACARRRGTAVAQTPASEPINPRSNQALYFTAGPEAGRPAGAAPSQLPPQVRSGPSGIALQMTECQVVAVAGSTDRVEISAGPGGQRLVTLTYVSGERPGIYRFVNGRLNTMERVAEQPQPRRAAKKPAR